MRRGVELDLPTVTAAAVTAPPAWALLERRLFEVMEEAAELRVSRYSQRGGVPSTTPTTWTTSTR